jgi:hypothetical protein
MTVFVSETKNNISASGQAMENAHLYDFSSWLAGSIYSIQ